MNLEALLVVALPCSFSGMAPDPDGAATFDIYLAPLDGQTRAIADAVLQRYLPLGPDLRLDSFIMKKGKQSLAQAEVQMAEIGKHHKRCIGYGAGPDGSVEIDHGCFKY